MGYVIQKMNLAWPEMEFDIDTNGPLDFVGIHLIITIESSI